MSPIETVTSVIPVRFHRVITGSTVAIAALVAGAASAGATSAATHPAVLALQVAAVRWPTSRLPPQATRPLPTGTTATWRLTPGRAGLAAVRARYLAVPRARTVQPEIVLAAAVTTSAARAATPLRKHGRGPRRIAIRLLHRYGWRPYQFRYLNLLWSRESGWRARARNPVSGAYGIPQALPGARMAAAGPDWRTSARTQILWGLEYIKRRYGSPLKAWKHEVAAGWY